MSGVLTVAHVRARDKSPLDIETELRVLRSSLWACLYLAQDLQLSPLACGLTAMVRDIDRLLGEFDLQ